MMDNMMKNKVFWCSNCLNMSTRPRISFNEKGQCNACTWSEEKKTFDWEKRKKELKDARKDEDNTQERCEEEKTATKL